MTTLASSPPGEGRPLFRDSFGARCSSTGGTFIHRFADSLRLRFRQARWARKLSAMNDVLALVDDPALTASLHRVAAATDRTDRKSVV